MKYDSVLKLTRRMSQLSLKGEIDHARMIFDQMGHRDIVSWNVMIKCYIENGSMINARELFDEMPDRTSVSWNTMIMGYIKEEKTHMAFKLFTLMPGRDVVSWTAMITGLCRASHVADAWSLFKQMPEANAVSWSSVISGFQQNGYPMESLKVFKEMLVNGVQPTAHSFSSAFAACASLASVLMSEQVFCQVFKRGFDSNINIVNSAISMFMKCGSFLSAMHLFRDLGDRDVVTWNSMIMGFAQHGYGEEAITMFHAMQKVGFLPDRVTYLGVLHGCSHCGLLNEAQRYFHSMEMDHGVSPGPEHYASMVDLYARARKLKEAYEMVMEMPYQPTTVFWRTLLNGCRIWGEKGLGIVVANRVLELEPQNSSAFFMVIDVLALAGKWMEVGKMRRRMRESETRKEVGFSWIDTKGKTHVFTMGETNHPELDEIFLIIELLAYDIASNCLDTETMSGN